MEGVLCVTPGVSDSVPQFGGFQSPLDNTCQVLALFLTLCPQPLSGLLPYLDVWKPAFSLSLLLLLLHLSPQHTTKGGLGTPYT